MLRFCDHHVLGSDVPFATLPMCAVDLYTRETDGFNT